MLHEARLLCLSDNYISPTFSIPCTFCDELVVNGDDRPSWIGSLVVEFKWLNKTRRVPTRYSEMADSHLKQRKEHQNHDKMTAHENNQGGCRWGNPVFGVTGRKIEQ